MNQSAHAPENGRLVIRELIPADCPVMAEAFARQGWHKPRAQFEAYWRESQAGQRTVLIAFIDSVFAAYVTIKWQSDYPPFQAAAIPEIVDFNVLAAYQRRGIGTALLAAAETRIAVQGATAGIGVGLLRDYGQAQRLYVRRGYVPDGRGIYTRGRWITHGEHVILDDDVVLYFTKDLQRP